MTDQEKQMNINNEEFLDQIIEPPGPLPTKWVGPYPDERVIKIRRDLRNATSLRDWATEVRRSHERSIFLEDVVLLLITILIVSFVLGFLCK